MILEKMMRICKSETCIYTCNIAAKTAWVRVQATDVRGHALAGPSRAEIKCGGGARFYLQIGRELQPIRSYRKS